MLNKINTEKREIGEKHDEMFEHCLTLVDGGAPFCLCAHKFHSNE